MNTPKDPTVHFPINYGWVNGPAPFDPVAETYVSTPDDSNLRPFCSTEARDLVAETLLFSDEQFRHLTRNAGKAGWLIFLTVTAVHAHIVIHDIDGEEIRDELVGMIKEPSTDAFNQATYSSFVYTPRVDDELVLLPKAFVDKDGYLLVGDTSTGYVLGTPLVTAWRCLKPTEIAKFAPVYRTIDRLQARLEDALDDVESMDEIQRILHAEEWDSDTTKAICEVIIASGRVVDDTPND
jgi:hypothetical protein